MKFFAAVAAFAGAVAAITGTGAVQYTTEVVTAYTTFCPEATKFAWGSKTFTITEPTTVTITDCPDHGCTVVKPMYTSTAVHCSGSGASCSGNSNGTRPWYPAGTGGVVVPSSNSTGASSPIVETSNAGKVAALSGAALAGVLAIAVVL